MGKHNASSAGKAFAPASLNGLTLRNRTIRAACYEGMSRAGEATESLVEHHRRVAEGGIGMTTVSYGCVAPDGLTFRDQLIMRTPAVDGLRRLTAAVHSEGAAASIQLTHGGFFADPKVIGGKPMGASKKFNNYRMTACRPMEDEDIQRVIDDFGEAARAAQSAGFDAVEVHAGHGYLLSQFLSPWTNQRDDEWGGDPERRAAFPAAVVRRVREAVGSKFPILVKMNNEDGFEGGIVIEDSIVAARSVEGAGADALIPSCGSTSRTPFYMLRGEVPIREMAKYQEGFLMRWSTRLFSRFMISEDPHTPLFLRGLSLQIKEAVSIPVVYVGGILSMGDIETLVDDGFAFAQIGRATIRDPDFVKRLASGELTESDCDICNRCIAAIYSPDGVVCVTAEEEAASSV